MALGACAVLYSTVMRTGNIDATRRSAWTKPRLYDVTA